MLVAQWQAVRPLLRSPPPQVFPTHIQTVQQLVATIWQVEQLVIGRMGTRVSLQHVSRCSGAHSDGVLGIEFKSSPYYEIKEQLGAPVVCEGTLESASTVGYRRLIFSVSDATPSTYCQGHSKSQ